MCQTCDAAWAVYLTSPIATSEAQKAYMIYNAAVLRAHPPREA